MRDTVASAVFATQTAPDPTATAVGPRPTAIVRVAPEATSIRVTESSPVFATHTAPSPKAMPVGRRPTLIALTAPSSNVAGLKRSTVESPEFATQTAPLPTTIAEDTPPVKADAATRASRRVDLRDRRVAERSPDRAASNGDHACARRSGRNVDGARHPVELHIYSRDLSAHPVTDPDTAATGGEPGRRLVVERDGGHCRALSRVDPRERPIFQVSDPDGALRRRRSALAGSRPGPRPRSRSSRDR